MRMNFKNLTFVNQKFSMDNRTKEFIQEHLNDDVLKLGLLSKRYPDIDIPLAIRQISGRQKFRKKVPVFYLNPDIQFPKQISVEQSSSEITAKYKSSITSGNTFADLTGGFGVDFYFLSQQFSHGIYVERDEELCELASHNFKVLGIKSFEIQQKSAEDYLSTIPDVDLIYVDPHRRNSSGKKTVLISDCEPDVSVLATQMLAKSPKILIKLSPMLDISQALTDLPQTSEIHILAVENECKEILLVLGKNNPDNEFSAGRKENIVIKTRNFKKNGNPQCFDFQLDTEVGAEVDFAISSHKFLYEPNAAIMKSGAFKSVAAHYELKKFHPNTHLYTADELKPDFPGRIFIKEQFYGNTKNDFRLLKQNYPKANIAVRNYPLSVEEYKKKSGIKDGGNVYIFAFKAYEGNFINFVCNKVGD
jgi:16S rRNA G966 N2-methylase RsmD